MIMRMRSNRLADAFAGTPDGVREQTLAGTLAGELRYSRVWEDHLLLERGLGVGAGGEYLVVASAGCNVLNLLLHEPEKIVAIDLNPAQTALVHLKLAGIQALERAEFLQLLGIVQGDAVAMYERVRPLLPDTVRDWWDTNNGTIAAGVDSAGKLDRFISAFQRLHIAHIHTPQLVERLFTLPSIAERKRFVDDELLTPEFEAAFRAYFTRESIAAGGRSEEQFHFVEECDVAGWMLDSFRWVCTTLPAQGNFYLERILRAPGHPSNTLPPYLKSGSYERLRALAPRVEVVTGDLESWLAKRRARTLAGAGLSNVFEYMAPDSAEAVFAAVAAAVRPKGRVVYWNFLVARSSPDSLRDRLVPLTCLAHALARRDRAWFYRDFHIEEVQ
jgi:S-adenosylmethionine-diacylglycerol 3-amino-3-carboxypropyl transferase